MFVGNKKIYVPVKLSCCSLFPNIIHDRRVNFWSIIALQRCVRFFLHSKMNQLYIYKYPLFFGFPSHLGYHRAWSGAPCAIQQALISAQLALTHFWQVQKNMRCNFYHTRNVASEQQRIAECYFLLVHIFFPIFIDKVMEIIPENKMKNENDYWSNNGNCCE